MDYKHIYLLLDKYWEGESTLEEEQTLQKFFREALNIPQDLEAERSYFVYLNTAQEIQLQQSPKRVAKTRPIRAWFAAASIILLLSIGVLYPMISLEKNSHGLIVTSLENTKEKISNYGTLATNKMDTYQDPQKAYESAKAMLQIMSTKLNKSVRQTSNKLQRIKQ
ncbi:MAG: hypothetical protein MK212_03770 [Saprospiraceae bacterium]|nr:hypothetical protein [Saprospiraceae bacterium]